MSTARAVKRAGFDVPQRLTLVEDDLDEMDAGIDRLDARLGKIMWTMVGLLISLTTGVVLLAANLVVGQ